MGEEAEGLILFFGWFGVFYLLADGWRWHEAKPCLGPAEIARSNEGNRDLGYLTSQLS